MTRSFSIVTHIASPVLGVVGVLVYTGLTGQLAPALVTFATAI